MSTTSKVSLSGLDGPGLPQLNWRKPEPATLVGASDSGLFAGSQGGGQQAHQPRAKLMVGLDFDTIINSIRHDDKFLEVPQSLCCLLVEPIKLLPAPEFGDRGVLVLSHEHSQEEIGKSLNDLLSKPIVRSKYKISELLGSYCRSLAQSKAGAEVAQPRLASPTEEPPRKELLTSAHMARLGPNWQERPVDGDHTRVELNWQLRPAVLPGGIGPVKEKLVFAKASDAGAFLKLGKTDIDTK